MSAADMLGHRDVCDLSAIDLRLRWWISIRTMPKDVGMPLHINSVGNHTAHVCAWG